MRPFLLVTGDFVKTGGMDRANFALASYLARHRAPVHLVAHRVDSELRTYPNVLFHRVPKIANSYLLSGPLLNKIGRFYARRVARRGGRVLTNGGNCWWGDINWVHHVHAADELYLSSGFLQRMKRHIDYQQALYNERHIIPKAKLVLTSCERTKRDIIKYLNIPEHKVQVIYYGSDSGLFVPATTKKRYRTRKSLDLPIERPLAIFIGALGNRRKGFDTLFQAWSLLCKDKKWDVKLVVVGRGSELSLWKKKTTALGIGNHIQFLGFVPDLPNTLAACDLFVLPSRYEGYSLATQEALCCGLPAIVSATAGVAERYPPELEDLLLPNPEDVDDLVGRLRCWRDQLEQYRQKVRSFSEGLRSYTWDDMAKSIVGRIKEA